MARVTDINNHHNRQNVLRKLALFLGRSSGCSNGSSARSLLNDSAGLQDRILPIAHIAKQTQREDDTPLSQDVDRGLPTSPLSYRISAPDNVPTYTAPHSSLTTIQTALHVASLDAALISAMNNYEYGPLSPIWTICHPDFTFRDGFMPSRAIGISEQVMRVKRLVALNPGARFEVLRREIVVMEGSEEAESRVVGEFVRCGVELRDQACLRWRRETSSVGRGEGRWSCVRMDTMSGTWFELLGC